MQLDMLYTKAAKENRKKKIAEKNAREVARIQKKGAKVLLKIFPHIYTIIPVCVCSHRGGGSPLSQTDSILR